MDLRADLDLSWYARPAARAWRCAAPDGAAAVFHRELPGYAPTPLTEVPALAAGLGVARLFVKDESARFDLRAFKFLGAAWAAYRALAARSGYAGPAGLAPLRAHLAASAPVSLVTATDGNHGRAVARTARLLGLPARVFLPRAVPAGVITRIEAEGAHLTVIDGDYDAAVAAAYEYSARADGASGSGAVLVQDTAWEGYSVIPAWIVEGYETLFAELDAQLATASAGAPDLVSVPIGVGSLAQAAVAHYRGSRSPARESPPERDGQSVLPGQARLPRQARLLGVEPDTAACALRSLLAGAPVSVPTGTTIMNGLNCGTVSGLAWPFLRDGLDACVTVTDAECTQAIGALMRASVASGPTGASAFAGLRAALAGPGAASRRADLNLPDDATVVCIVTEGPLADSPG